jgi:nucleotide-binding universal stress UspA family protein
VLAIPPRFAGRAGARRRSRETAARGPIAFSRIVVPIDLAADATADLAQAAALARSFDAELLLVHVVSDEVMPPWFEALRPGRSQHTRLKRADRALARAAAPIFTDVRVATRVISGNVAREIARVAAENPATLLVMGLRGTRGFWQARRGAIAYAVLTRTSTPVLALPRRSLGGTISKRLRRAVSHVLAERDQMEMAGVDALLSAAAPPIRTPRRRARR